MIQGSGHRIDIPTLVAAWDSNHCFPSGNQRILQLLFGENPVFSQNNLNTSKEGDFKDSLIQIENEIPTIVIEDYTESIITLTINKSHAMINPISATIRELISLGETNKMKVCEKIGLDTQIYLNFHSNDRDIEIIKKVKENELFEKLWEQINIIKPFESLQNPFKNTTI